MDESLLQDSCHRDQRSLRPYALDDGSLTLDLALPIPARLAQTLSSPLRWATQRASTTPCELPPNN